MKKFLAMLLCVVMVLSLCACTATKEEAPAEKPAEAAPAETEAEAPAEAAPVEIALWTFPVGDWGDKATVDKLLEGFNAVHPEIKVTVEYLAYGGDGDAKIDAAIEGNQAPDIVFEGPERLVANWGAKGVMVDLADLWTDEVKADTYESVEAACHNAEGAYYEYPLCMTAHCMAINKNMFEAADALQYVDLDTHTWTTENFIKACEALTASGQANIGDIFCNGSGGDQGTRALINNLYGGTFTDEAHSKYTADSEENIKALEQLNSMDGFIFDSATNGGQEADLFAQGTLAMAFCWNAATHAAREEVIGDAFEVIPMAFPSPNGTDTKLCGGIWGFGIFDNGDADRIEAAKTFVKYMADENITDAVAASGFWSTRKSAEDIYPGDEMKAVYGSFMPYMGDYYNVIPGWTEARTAWSEMLQSIGTGTAPAEAAATFAEVANAAAAK
ncbi:MAG: extracellular solute-binding protein [Candidatus Limivicinus sp.]|jgi:multiple sugar transport system substrate-binding protein